MHVYFIDICNMKVSVYTGIKLYSQLAAPRARAAHVPRARRARTARVTQICCCGDFRDLIVAARSLYKLCCASARDMASCTAVH